VDEYCWNPCRIGVAALSKVWSFDINTMSSTVVLKADGYLFYGIYMLLRISKNPPKSLHFGLTQRSGTCINTNNAVVAYPR